MATVNNTTGTERIGVNLGAAGAISGGTSGGTSGAAVTIPGNTTYTLAYSVNTGTNTGEITGNVTGEIILALADTAAALRAARANNQPIPLACAGGHAAARFIPWGPALMCCACGCRPVPADQLHALLTRALREQVQIQEGKAA